MLKILKQIKGVFIPPKRHYYFGRVTYGSPYMYPRKYNRTILSIRKVRATYERNFNFNLLGYNIAIGSPIWLTWHGLGWKDKFDSPRHEWNPAFYLYLFNWQLVVWLVDPKPERYGRYWEMVLWYLSYCSKDIKKAEETWGWVDSKTKLSTWDSDYLIKQTKP